MSRVDDQSGTGMYIIGTFSYAWARQIRGKAIAGSGNHFS